MVSQRSKHERPMVIGRLRHDVRVYNNDDTASDFKFFMAEKKWFITAGMF